MGNKNSLLKIISLLGLFALALIYAWPNIYREVPVVEVSASTPALQKQLLSQVQGILDKYQFGQTNVSTDEQNVTVVFKDTDSQLKAKDILQKKLGNDYTVALNLQSSMPSWLKAFGAKPMKLGLDLKGGVHFLLDVDMQTVIKHQYEDSQKEVASFLKSKKMYYSGIRHQLNQGILIRLREPKNIEQVKEALDGEFQNYVVTIEPKHQWIQMQMSPFYLHELRQMTVEQTMSILRHRVNELGVAEAVVQQQGEHRIAVDLPGIQDAARAKSILGGTATLEFRLMDEQHDPLLAVRTGNIPSGSMLFFMDDRPILLKKEVILNGDAITSASSAVDGQTGTPSVSISINSDAAKTFSDVTRENIGHHLSIVYVETKSEEVVIGQETETILKRSERVISNAVINTQLGKDFQITGLNSSQEATKLAILLRSGALPTSIFTVEERTIGPSLGLENIRSGMLSLMVGMLVVLSLMLVYYRLFGVIADIALVLNLVFLVSLLSLIGATLTLPGIAGIVLTLGMAVDTNVLINERIREELRLGLSVPAAIHAGYERAFATILDANVTTFIVGLILFSFGSGPIKGFAITLCLGLVTSMLSGVTYSRAMVNAIYGGRKVDKISIGI
ncbi:MAG TPA: protein translocase subunit SecD [Legionellales bacterium]|nr:protein translocase subunit SecD [Legionellales bacterium]